MPFPDNIHIQTLGQGQSLVLLHGWAMHSGIWQEFARQLAQKYQVSCVDLPGHGLSTKRDCFSLVEISGEIVNAVPDKSSVWLGWSLGATVALAIAGQYPERARGLVLLAGTPRFCCSARENWPGMEESVFKHFSHSLQQNSALTIQRFLSLQVTGMPDAKAMLKTMKTLLSSRPQPDPMTMQAGLKLLETADLRLELTSITQPVAAILGREDRLIPVAAGQKMKQIAPQLDLTVIEQAGHVPFLSHPQKVLSCIEIFMENNALK